MVIHAKALTRGSMRAGVRGAHLRLKTPAEGVSSVTAELEGPDETVVFMAHGLAPDMLSTEQITPVLEREGSRWATPEDFGPEGELPPVVEWFRCPVVHEDRRVELRFRIAPIFGLPLYKAYRRGGADKLYQWFDDDATTSVVEAHASHRPVQLGWGAYTKIVTDHGERYLKQNSEVHLHDWLATSHGDNGTVHFITEAMKQAEIPKGSTIAVIGSLGAIGSGLTLSLRQFAPKKVVLVVRPGTEAERLREFIPVVKWHLDRETEVVVHEDMTTACIEHDAHIVLLATNGKEDLQPHHVPRGSMVFDTTTPSATQDGPWLDRAIFAIRAGCALVPTDLFPEGFGRDHTGQIVWDRGAGGHKVIWGCTAECIARALVGKRGHVAGQRLQPADVIADGAMFRRLGFEPQPAELPDGRFVPWERLQEFSRKVLSQYVR